MNAAGDQGGAARGFQFPGEFGITAMGDAAAELQHLVPQLLATAGVTVIAGSLSTRPSRQGNYIAARVRIRCRDRDEYAAAHATLRAHAAIHFTL